MVNLSLLTLHFSSENWFENLLSFKKAGSNMPNLIVNLLITVKNCFGKQLHQKFKLTNLTINPLKRNSYFFEKESPVIF